MAVRHQHASIRCDGHERGHAPWWFAVRGNVPGNEARSGLSYKDGRLRKLRFALVGNGIRRDGQGLRGEQRHCSL